MVGVRVGGSRNLLKFHAFFQTQSRSFSWQLNANIIYGQIIDEELKDAVRITVIATGFKVGASQSSMDFAPRKDLFASTEPAPQPVQQAPVTFSAPAPTSRFTDEDYIPDFLKRAR